MAKDPSSPAARDLGILYSRTGRVVEAYALLRPWVLNHASDGDARLVVAALAVELERPDEALQVLAGMVESPPMRLLQARALTQKGDTAAALKLLQPILAQHPPAVDLKVRRVAAAAYLGAGQPEKVVELLQGKAGKVPDLVLLLGRAQRQLGRNAAALATLQPLADALPDDPSTLGDPRPAAGIAVEYGAVAPGERPRRRGDRLLAEGDEAQPAEPRGVERARRRSRRGGEEGGGGASAAASREARGGTGGEAGRDDCRRSACRWGRRERRRGRETASRRTAGAQNRRGRSGPSICWRSSSRSRRSRWCASSSPPTRATCSRTPCRSRCCW